MSDELKRSEVLSFVDGTLSVKMSGYGRADKWGVLKFDEEQIETKPHDDRNGNYIEIEIPPTELLEIRDFLSRIFGENPPLPVIEQSLCGAWQPIETYPFELVPKDDPDGDKWGPEVLVLTRETKTHIIIHVVAQPEFTVPPQRIIARLEADMWLSRRADDLISVDELEHAPTHWMPIAEPPK